jgi:hypothetical protein
LSIDNGATWGDWLPCANGQVVPGIDELESLQNVQLKTRAVLTTSDVHASPELQEVNIEIITAWADITLAYGPNKSTLTGWDSISLAWKPERLSLVVNDEEACFIENPGLPAALGSHIFIGTDRNGANAINTLVDELRIDKIYREVNIRTGWHKTGVPFYTSEDMKQWPGYLKAETDGLKVYDSSDALRVLVGSWLKDAVRKYGIKIIDGEIYSSLISTAGEGAQNFIRLNPPHNLEVYGAFGDNPATLQLIISAAGGGGNMWFYNDGLLVGQMGAGAEDKLYLFSFENKLVVNGYGGVEVIGGLNVSGGIKNCVDPTENYGFRAMSAVESPEILFYDRGQVDLVNGEATVYFDPIYLEMIEPDAELTPWQIWVQCYGENDVYVSEVGENYFKVKERNSGMSNDKVVWRFEAIRKGYAGIRLMEVTN